MGKYNFAGGRYWGHEVVHAGVAFRCVWWLLWGSESGGETPFLVTSTFQMPDDMPRRRCIRYLRRRLAQAPFVSSSPPECDLQHALLLLLLLLPPLSNATCTVCCLNA